jgi:hypothetical protein
VSNLPRDRDTDQDDGAAHRATQGDHLETTGDGNLRTAAATILPASQWNAGTVYQSTLLNTLDGTQMRVSVNDKGEEIVRARRAKVPAHHFTISGDRDVWFDRGATLVRVQFAGKDGSTIVYDLR